MARVIGRLILYVVIIAAVVWAIAHLVPEDHSNGAPPFAAADPPRAIQHAYLPPLVDPQNAEPKAEPDLATAQQMQGQPEDGGLLGELIG